MIARLARCGLAILAIGLIHGHAQAQGYGLTDAAAAEWFESVHPQSTIGPFMLPFGKVGVIESAGSSTRCAPADASITQGTLPALRAAENLGWLTVRPDPSFQRRRIPEGELTSGIIVTLTQEGQNVWGRRDLDFNPSATAPEPIPDCLMVLARRATKVIRVVQNEQIRIGDKYYRTVLLTALITHTGAQAADFVKIWNAIGAPVFSGELKYRQLIEFDPMLRGWLLIASDEAPSNSDFASNNVPAAINFLSR
jgi:hypothetical protein